MEVCAIGPYLDNFSPCLSVCIESQATAMSIMYSFLVSSSCKRMSGRRATISMSVRIGTSYYRNGTHFPPSQRHLEPIMPTDVVVYDLQSLIVYIHAEIESLLLAQVEDVLDGLNSGSFFI